MACPLLMPEFLPYAKATPTGTLLLRRLPGRTVVRQAAGPENSTENAAAPQRFVQHGVAGLPWVRLQGDRVTCQAM
jgi:hypothetical protein